MYQLAVFVVPRQAPVSAHQTPGTAVEVFRIQTDLAIPDCLPTLLLKRMIVRVAEMNARFATLDVLRSRSSRGLRQLPALLRQRTSQGNTLWYGCKRDKSDLRLSVPETV